MAKRRQGKVPSFALYGEQPRGEPARRLHIEDIRARSQRYAWEIAAHTHRGLHQCLVLLSGAARVRVDEHDTELAAPALVLLPPGTVHAFRFREHTHGYVLSFAADALLGGEAAGHAAALLGPFEQPRLLALDAGDGGVARIGALLEAHYLEHWPVARYARKLGLTASRLNRLCVRQSGRSAFALAQERLALEARRRLIYIALPVAQLARELGFRDPAYFSRFFRRHAGLPPDRYRRQHGAG